PGGEVEDAGYRYPALCIRRSIDECRVGISLLAEGGGPVVRDTPRRRAVLHDDDGAPVHAAIYLCREIVLVLLRGKLLRPLPRLCPVDRRVEDIVDRGLPEQIGERELVDRTPVKLRTELREREPLILRKVRANGIPERVYEARRLRQQIELQC